MGISLKDIFKNDEERLVENRRKTAIKNMIIFGCVIAVLIVLAIVVKFWGNVDEERRIAITNDVQNIRSAILLRAKEQLVDPSLGDYPGIKLEDQEEPLTLNINGVTEEYRYGYYLLYTDTLKEIVVSLNLPDEAYIVNYETGDVVNATGIKYKKRRYHSIDDLLAIAAGNVPVSDTVVVVTKASDLNKMRERPNGYFKLSANIDMSEYSNGEGWNPIPQFTGILDGRGYTISNLTINRPTQSYVGLLGDVKSTAKITNLKLENVNIVGGQYTGALAGNCAASVSYVHVNSGNVSGPNTSTGGLVGAYSIQKMNNCTAKVNVDGNNNVGGLIGTLYSGTVNKVSADGDVTANENVGGLIGLARVSTATYITEAAAHTAVNGKTNLGGLVGSVEMTSSNDLRIENCYAKGSIQTGEENIGGMFGRVYTAQGTPNLVLSSLYTSVSVVVKGETSGGFVGYSAVGNSTSKVNENCFWEKAIAPGEVLNGVGKEIEGSGLAFPDKTSNEMKMRATYTSWNFETVWEIEERISTPTLKWEKNYVGVKNDKK